MRDIWDRGSFVLLILGIWQLIVLTTAWGHELRETDDDDAVYRWGPYRPNLYFGVRPQVPDTILMGMMWGQGKDKSSLIHSMS